MTDRRIEILGGGSIIAIPFRIPWVWRPHCLLLAFILLAWLADFAVRLWGWFGL